MLLSLRKKAVTEHDSQKYLFYKQTHTLDSKEMSELIDGVVKECKDAGIETLDDIQIRNLFEEIEK